VRGLSGCDGYQQAVNDAQSVMDSFNRQLAAINDQMSSASPEQLADLMNSQTAMIGQLAAAGQELTRTKNELANCQSAIPSQIVVPSDPKCNIPGQYWDPNSNACINPAGPDGTPGGPSGGEKPPAPQILPPTPTPGITCPAGQQPAPDGKSCVPVPVAAKPTNWLLIGGVAAAAAVGIFFFMGGKKKGTARSYSAAH
jgi:hypothetical protein